MGFAVAYFLRFEKFLFFFVWQNITRKVSFRHFLSSNEYKNVKNEFQLTTKNNEKYCFATKYFTSYVPRAQTACSQTFCCGDFSKLRNKGTALASTTAWVCCEVPEAILVKAQAASNCKEGLSLASRHLTRTGKIPELIRASIGGFRSEDNNFLAAWTATNWVAGSALE